MDNERVESHSSVVAETEYHNVLFAPAVKAFLPSSYIHAHKLGA